MSELMKVFETHEGFTYVMVSAKIWIGLYLENTLPSEGRCHSKFETKFQIREMTTTRFEPKTLQF